IRDRGAFLPRRSPCAARAGSYLPQSREAPRSRGVGRTGGEVALDLRRRHQAHADPVQTRVGEDLTFHPGWTVRFLKNSESWAGRSGCGAFSLGLDFPFHPVRFSDGRLTGMPWFMAAAIALAVAQALRANYVGAGLVVGALGAHPISFDDPKNQVVIDVVREMALAARIPAPRIDVIDDPSPNAFAIGRDPE